MKIGVIGGTGVYDPEMIQDSRDIELESIYGALPAKAGNVNGDEIVFIARHGYGHSIPPHKINYRANIMGLKNYGVERIIATSAVGSLNMEMKPGDFVILSDFIDFTKDRILTFFDGDERGVVHTDFTEPYCGDLRRVIAAACEDLGINVHKEGVYVCTEGPRFETPAEIKMFQRLGGDLVGMTNVPEVVLAREAGICYGVIAMVTNFAAGISKEPLTHEEVVEVMGQNNDNIKRIISRTIMMISSGRCSKCGRDIKPMGK